MSRDYSIKMNYVLNDKNKTCSWSGTLQVWNERNKKQLDRIDMIDTTPSTVHTKFANILGKKYNKNYSSLYNVDSWIDVITRDKDNVIIDTFKHKIVMGGFNDVMSISGEIYSCGMTNQYNALSGFMEAVREYSSRFKVKTLIKKHFFVKVKVKVMEIEEFSEEEDDFKYMMDGGYDDGGW